MRNGDAFAVKESVQKARDFVVVFRRAQEDGWPRNQAAVFDLAAYGQEERHPKAAIPPMAGVGVGSSYTFDLELLSEEDAKGLPQ